MVSFLFVLLAAMLVPGVINRTRAVLSGRKGIRFGQHLWNVQLLLRKGAVYSTAAGPVFRAAPAVYLGAILTASLFVPLGGYDALFHFDGDVVMFAYLLAASRVALILGALDTGSSFEGMGASREALYGALIEPALFLVAGTLALMTGHTSFSTIFQAIGSTSTEMVVVTLLLAFIVVKIMIVETGRIPVDDPRTHLELTMIHEVMILDYSGIDLGLITIGGWIKAASLAVIAAGTIASTIGYAGLSAVVILLMVVVISIFIGVVESAEARNRLNRNPTYVLTVTSLALFAFLLVYVLTLNIEIL